MIERPSKRQLVRTIWFRVEDNTEFNKGSTAVEIFARRVLSSGISPGIEGAFISGNSPVAPEASTSPTSSEPFAVRDVICVTGKLRLITSLTAKGSLDVGEVD